MEPTERVSEYDFLPAGQKGGSISRRPMQIWGALGDRFAGMIVSRPISRGLVGSVRKQNKRDSDKERERAPKACGMSAMLESRDLLMLP